MKKVLEKILYLLSRGILWRQKPKVVGITGTVGKTSAKEAVFAVLSKKFKTRKNIKNYNNEIGVPLTIIGSETGGKNPFKWLWIFIKSIWLMIMPAGYPKILILEMGIDKPGDMDYLLKISRPHVGVVTAIGEEIPVHVEFFKNVGELVKEKMKMATRLSEKDFAILNADDSRIMKFPGKIKAEAITFGHSKNADISLSEVSISTDLKNAGIHFKIFHEGNTVPFHLNNVLGIHQSYSAAIAAAVGLVLGMNLVDISEALKEYRPPKGRMTLIKGIKNSWLIDDSYNSSPEAAKRAIEFLAEAGNGGRKIACLGNMEELGKHTEAAHANIGQLIQNSGINYLVTIGDKGEIIAEAAKQAGMPEENIIITKDSPEAGLKIQAMLQEGDIVLIKGSQSIRAEKVTKELMADPMKAKELLIRQDKLWEE
ncbi:UDP-N-acetylmuramoyl-tripeptide--D-alanyl-D-alanine ligase [Patescibacteria group bacterium]|nr:UDP-N-acetylmuramoyl-tripeptide--D-alanyl-D-alanine ligase [Patescibacteria group bacterium]MBU1672913.1 UDP-N-acetylmuramoyl-tripeptide--D-alanyl-D-alanine ligase [Patescibacteria group bacterium]MBU1963384.1 UDP-N-acetylmuramoyl-tripeptide--D-alanyl-D-alanine ligase [Patescibacteria group bacterium]